MAFYVRVVDIYGEPWEPPTSFASMMQAEEQLLQYALSTEGPHEKLMIREDTKWDGMGVSHYNVHYFALHGNMLVSRGKQEYVRQDIQAMLIFFVIAGVISLAVVLGLLLRRYGGL